VKAYLDSSALVKLYYPEPESERVERWVHLHNPQLLLPGRDTPRSSSDWS